MVASITPSRPQTTTHTHTRTLWHIHTATSIRHSAATSSVSGHAATPHPVLSCPTCPYPALLLLLWHGICRCRHGVVVAGRNIKFLVIYTGQTEAGNISAAAPVAAYVCVCVCVCEWHAGAADKGVGFSCRQSELSQSWRFFCGSFCREVCRCVEDMTSLQFVQACSNFLETFQNIWGS